MISLDCVRLGCDIKSWSVRESMIVQITLAYLIYVRQTLTNTIRVPNPRKSTYGRTSNNYSTSPSSSSYKIVFLILRCRFLTKYTIHQSQSNLKYWEYLCCTMTCIPVVNVKVTNMRISYLQCSSQSFYSR